MVGLAMTLARVDLELLDTLVGCTGVTNMCANNGIVVLSSGQTSNQVLSRPTRTYTIVEEQLSVGSMLISLAKLSRSYTNIVSRSALPVKTTISNQSIQKTHN